MKQNSSLTLTLTRHLHLPSLPSSEPSKPPLQITDTLTSVNFKGPEYVCAPGTEGVAMLVFDVPVGARTVGGGRRGSVSTLR